MKFKKRPVVVEAFQYDGDMVYSNGIPYVPQWAIDAYNNGDLYYESIEDGPPCELFIKTLEGAMHVSLNDFVIRGISGELYPCKPYIFEETYEPAE